MATTHIRTLLFDLGNVLFDLDIPATERALTGLLGEQAPGFKSWAEDTRFFERFETGELSNAEFVREIQGRCVPGTTVQAITAAWNAMLLGMPESRLTWLKELSTEFRVALLSNTNDLHITWVRAYLRNAYGIGSFEDEFFHKVYYSHEIGARKPEAAAFQHVLDDLGVTGTEVLFVDDVDENTAQAASMGIQVQLHQPGREIRDYLPLYLRKVIG